MVKPRIVKAICSRCEAGSPPSRSGAAIYVIALKDDIRIFAVMSAL
jgi:hypothetical protein